MVRAGHLVWMETSRPTNKAEAVKRPGSRKRVKLRLGREDCINRDVRKAVDDEKWMEKAAGREKRKESKSRGSAAAQELGSLFYKENND